MVQPVFAEFPPAPSRSDAPVDFSAKADTFVAALPPFALKMNQAIAWMVESMTAISASESAAAASATQAALAASTATQARDAAQLAVTQATANGAAQVALATAAAQTAQIAAAAAGAATGIGDLGLPGEALMVNPAGTGLVYGPTAKVGEVILAAKKPSDFHIQTTAGGIRAQSSWPTLFAALGLIGAQIGQAFSTVALSGQSADVASAPAADGSQPPLVMHLPTTVGAITSLNFSTDGGLTFSAKVSTGLTLAAGSTLSYDELNRLWIVATGTNTYFTSADDGETWATRTIGTSTGRIVADINGVWVATQPTASASILRSVNKGQSWSIITNGSSVLQTAISTDNKGVWIIAAGSTVRRSVDGGVTWTASVALNNTINAVSNNRNGVWLISGLTSISNTWKSTDNGLSWLLVATPVTSTVSDIAYSKGFFFVARNVSPQLLILSDSPDSAFIVPAAGVLASLFKVTAINGYLIGVANSAGSTTAIRSAPTYAYDSASQFALPVVPAPDGLQAWIKAANLRISTPYSFALYAGSLQAFRDIETDDKGVVITAGDAIGSPFSIALYRSSNYGETFERTGINLASNQSGRSIATNKKGTWVVFGNGGTIFRSTDNGLTWSIVNNTFGSTDTKIAFGKDDVLMALTTNGTVRRSTDYGTTWTTVKTGSATTTLVLSTNGEGLWLIGANTIGYLFISTDNGATLSAESYRATTATLPIASIAQVGQIGLAVCLTGRVSSIRRSVDGGLTWLTSPNSENRGAVALNKYGYAAAAGASGIVVSTNFGQSWLASDPTNPTDVFVKIIGGDKGPFLFVSSASSKIAKSTSTVLV